MKMSGVPQVSGEGLAQILTEARARTLDLVADLTDEQMMGPRLSIVNPPLWEIGHVGWFQEFWTLRHLQKQKPAVENGDALYNSTDVIHDTRWDLQLLSRDRVLAYMKHTLDRVVEGPGAREFAPEEVYFHRLVTFHEDMHDEALTYTRQTLGYPAPRFTGAGPLARKAIVTGGPFPGDVEIPGGILTLGATPDFPFVFDNEKWAHPVEVKSFRIARAPVTNKEFTAFVEDGGYKKREFWSEEGWLWLQSGRNPALDRSFSAFWKDKGQSSKPSHSAEKAEHPVYWQCDTGGRWLQRVFDTHVPLEDHLPVIHVNWYEAEAYCNWAGRRLPTEAEWEMAASAEPTADGSGISERKRRYPWGEELPTPDRANLDWQRMGLVEVGALAAGDSAFGCRQMIGNVWEWTASDFLPYPGFVIDPYKEYSKPWFSTHKVLRGGCWTTRSRLIRNTWRNFYTPDRRDVWAGFRTCAK
jgi:iron(II)-dependent oxidoreductase